MMTFLASLVLIAGYFIAMSFIGAAMMVLRQVSEHSVPLFVKMLSACALAFILIATMVFFIEQAAAVQMLPVVLAFAALLGCVSMYVSFTKVEKYMCTVRLGA